MIMSLGNTPRGDKQNVEFGMVYFYIFNRHLIRNTEKTKLEDSLSIITYL